MKDYHEMEDLPLVLSVDDLVHVLPMSKAGIYNMMDQEGFPLVKIGKRKLVLRQDLLNWLSESKEGMRG